MTSVLASVFAFAPLADAAPAPADTTQRVPAADETSGSTAPVDEVTPDYGYQKYRVGVRGKTGAYFPDGTSTAGTVLTVTTTAADGDKDSFECTTVANSDPDVEHATFCPGDLRDERRSAAARRVAGVVESTPVGEDENVYTASPGTTVSVTQKTVNPNLVTDSTPVTLGACERNFFIVCIEPDAGNEIGRVKSTDLVMVDPGIPPVAKDDSGKTEQGVAVTVDIEANDTAHALVTKVELVGDPKHGSASLVTAESADPTPTTSAPTTSAPTTSAPTTSAPSTPTTSIPVPSITLGNVDVLRAPAGAKRSLAAVTSYLAKYTPAAGFTGVDTFDYRITTANGTATATVTVTVTGSGVDASETTSNGVDASTDSRDNDLADTGTQSETLLGWGVGLLAVGGGALAAGVQRRRGRHAR